MQILKTKIYLAEGREIAPSFMKYMRHYRAQYIKTTLDRAGLPANVKDPGFPEQFYYDVKAGLARAAARYDDSIHDLQRAAWPFDKRSTIDNDGSSTPATRI